MGKVFLQIAKAIVTCDAQDQVFYNCDLLIDGPKLISVGTVIEPDDPRIFGAKVIDASGMFIYPGLVKILIITFFETFVRNLTTIDYPNLTVMDWIDQIYRIFQKIDDQVIFFYSSLTAMADLLKHGCTTAFDNQYCYTTFTGKRPVDRQMEAARLLGIRYHAGRGGNTLPREKGSSIPQPDGGVNG